MSAEPEPTVEESQRLIDLCWLDCDRTGAYLHHATITDVEHDYETTWRNLRLDCGQVAVYASIPGVLTRMGARRCGACCDINGLPRGKGSPKNIEHWAAK